MSNKYITSHGVTERTRRNRDGTTSRVEALGAMNDRRRAAISRRDKAALLILADEYEKLGMRLTALAVRRDAR